MKEPNQVHTLDIDQIGEIAVFDLRGREVERGLDGDAVLVGLNITGGEAADYAVDVGGEDPNGNKVWFTDEATYSAATDVSDAWRQAERYARLRVTSAASADTTADVLLAEGE